MKHTWMIAALLSVAACVSPEAHRRVLNANEALQAQIAGLADARNALAAQNQRLLQENQDLGTRAADAAWIEKMKLANAQNAERLEAMMKRFGAGASTAIPGVEMVATSEGYAFRVAGGVLFAPGQNALSEQGRRTLSELAKELEGRRLRIEGHTDDQPIVRSQWGTNLRLSMERAMTVADYLIESAGLPAQQVGVAGYGEFRPAVEGSTDDARKANRRVEILMLDR